MKLIIIALILANNKFSCFFFFSSEREDGEVWYYSTKNQLDELLDRMDENVMEKALYREINSMRDVVIKHMNLTEAITNAAKAGRKSYLEVENGKISLYFYFCLLLVTNYKLG